MPRSGTPTSNEADPTPSGRPAPSAQGSVEQVVARAALDLVNDLTGPDGALPPGSLTFSPESLAHLEVVLEAMHQQWIDSGRSGAPVRADVRNALGSYLGEVARKEFGGRYVPGDAQNPFLLAVGSPQVRLAVCGRITDRIVEGRGKSVELFLDGVAPALRREIEVTLL